MDYSTAVNVLQTTQDLVKEKLDMVVTERLFGNNDLAEVCIHEFGYHVKFIELFDATRVEDVFELQNVVVAE